MISPGILRSTLRQSFIGIEKAIGIGIVFAIVVGEIVLAVMAVEHVRDTVVIRVSEVFPLMHPRIRIDAVDEQITIGIRLIFGGEHDDRSDHLTDLVTRHLHGFFFLIIVLIFLFILVLIFVIIRMNDGNERSLPGTDIRIYGKDEQYSKEHPQNDGEPFRKTSRVFRSEIHQECSSGYDALVLLVLFGLATV